MVTDNARMLSVRLLRQAMAALCVAGALFFALPSMSFPRTNGVGHASAANCNGWANNPYSIGAWAYGKGGLSCNGSQLFSFQACLRKQRDYFSGRGHRVHRNYQYLYVALSDRPTMWSAQQLPNQDVLLAHWDIA